MARKKSFPTKVVVSNELAKVSYHVGLRGERLLLLFIASIGREELSPDRVYSANIQDIAEAFQQSKKYTYEMVKEAIEEIYESTVILKPTTTKTVKFRWVDYISYDDDDYNINFRWNKDIIPYISSLVGNFNIFQIKEITNLDTRYSLRLFEIFNAVRNKIHNTLTLSIDDLKEFVGVTAEYKLYGTFKQKILLPSLESIEQHTNMSVKYREIKEGKKVTQIHFTIEMKV
jgi:plasmid replication initiation protein